MLTLGAKTTGSRSDRSHFGALRRFGAVVLVSVVSSTASGCYRYAEIPVTQPVEAERVQFILNDEGRTQLRRQLGPSARSIEGRVITKTAEAYSVAVYRLTNVGGDAFSWSGEEVVVAASGVELAMRRDFDKVGTVVAMASLAGAVTLFVLSRSLLGGGRDSGETPVPPVQSVR